VFNVGTPELLLILLVALVVLGPTKLPEAARQVGRAMAEFRRISTGFQAEMRDALQEPVKLDPVEPEPTPDPAPPRRTRQLRAAEPE
jgi:Tat protein translocase TatB subunit